MGLLEWLGETCSPGPIGDVHVGRGRRKRVTRRYVLATGVLSLLLLGGSTWLMLGREGASTWLVLVGVAAYLVAAYFVHPKPETSNLGWLGGLVDHPFRWSDDANRLLLLLLMLLLPGRFVAESLVDLCALIWRPLSSRKP